MSKTPQKIQLRPLWEECRIYEYWTWSYIK